MELAHVKGWNNFLDILDIKVQTPSLQEAKRKPLLF